MSGWQHGVGGNTPCCVSSFVPAHVCMCLTAPTGFCLGSRTPWPVHTICHSALYHSGYGVHSGTQSVHVWWQHLLLHSSCSCDFRIPRIAACVSKLNTGAFRKPNRIVPSYNRVHFLAGSDRWGWTWFSDVPGLSATILGLTIPRTYGSKPCGGNGTNGQGCCSQCWHRLLCDHASLPEAVPCSRVFPFCLHVSWSRFHLPCFCRHPFVPLQSCSVCVRGLDVVFLRDGFACVCPRPHFGLGH
jgi:hypothetical protein